MRRTDAEFGAAVRRLLGERQRPFYRGSIARRWACCI